MSDAPVCGRAAVASLFGVSTSTLKRWQSDAELEQRLRLRDFTFRLGGRWATTERLATQFLDHVRSIDPREATRRQVAETANEFRRRGVA